MAVTVRHRDRQPEKVKYFPEIKSRKTERRIKQLIVQKGGSRVGKEREREREWQKTPDSLCCLPWKSVSPLAGRLRMLMGIPFSPQSALKAQDNNLLLQVWLWLSHDTSFSPLTLNKKRMISCSACYLSAALTAEVKVLIEALGHLLDLRLF